MLNSLNKPKGESNESKLLNREVGCWKVWYWRTGICWKLALVDVFGE
jgi:hypothetical protein